MMSEKSLAFLFCFFCLAFAAFSSAAAQPSGSAAAASKGDGLPPGSYVLRYKFSRGESVTYRVLSYDSIVIWDAEPRVLIRQRAEQVTYRCDTVLPDGYGMTATLDQAVVRERLDSLPWTIRTEHQLVGQPIRFLMKEDGERVRLRETPAVGGSMPGAPFQPLLIPHLGGVDTVSAGAGSVFEREMWLLDNVYPPVMWQGGGMRKILGTADTLGRHTLVVELSEVGQVWYTPPTTTGDTLITHTRLNGGGRYWLAFDEGYPLTGEYQLVGNITFTNSATGKERLGRHTISMEFQVDTAGKDLEELFEGLQ